MKSSTSLTQISKSVTRFMHRYHLILFTVLALGGVIVVTLILNNVAVSSEPSKVSTPYVGFDKETIEKLDTLNISPEAATTPPVDILRGPRTPFVE